MGPTIPNVKQRILDVACRLFAEHGYDNVSTRQIAEKANVRHGSLHYYFTNKENLYAHIFRIAYGLDETLTYDILRKNEPLIFDTPEGRAYAVQRVVFDYFQRHVFMPEEWKQRLVARELSEPSSVFSSYVEKKLVEETEKMTGFFYVLCPDGSAADAYYWAQLPCAQALYHFETLEFVRRRYDKDFIDVLNKTIVKRTAKLMIAFLDLPIPQMLK